LDFHGSLRFNFGGCSIGADSSVKPNSTVKLTYIQVKTLELLDGNRGYPIPLDNYETRAAQALERKGMIKIGRVNKPRQYADGFQYRVHYFSVTPMGRKWAGN
jgi:hypothetical protein